MKYKVVLYDCSSVLFLLIINACNNIAKFKNISFDKSVGISKNCYFNAIEGEIKVGEKTAFNVGCHINSSIGGKILIGKRCPIGLNVVMRTTNHNYIDKKKFIQEQGNAAMIL